MKYDITCVLHNNILQYPPPMLCIRIFLHPCSVFVSFYPSLSHTHTHTAHTHIRMHARTHTHTHTHTHTRTHTYARTHTNTHTPNTHRLLTQGSGRSRNLERGVQPLACKAHPKIFLGVATPLPARKCIYSWKSELNISSRS